jgi:hypothetical protein
LILLPLVLLWQDTPFFLLYWLLIPSIVALIPVIVGAWIRGGSDHPTASKVRPDRTIDLHQLDGCPSDLDEGNPDAWAGAVRFDDDVVTSQRILQVVDLEGDVGNGFHKIGIRRAFPITLPLDTKGIVLMITHRHLQVREWDLALEPRCCRDANVVELQ